MVDFERMGNQHQFYIFALRSVRIANYTINSYVSTGRWQSSKSSREANVNKGYMVFRTPPRYQINMSSLIRLGKGPEKSSKSDMAFATHCLNIKISDLQLV